MSNLQKLVECWRPIESFDQKAGAYLLKGEGFVWEDFWRETATGDAYWEESGDFEPTHYMPLDTPEKLAKIVGVLVDALRHLRRDDVRYHSPDDVNNFMDEALQQAEKIAGE